MKQVLFFILLFVSLWVQAQNLSIDNTAVRSQKKGFYNWTIFINAADSVLNSIDHVEYLLDRTFKTPQVSVVDRKSKFAYSAIGWGEFEIKAKVVFKNKSSKYFTYWLKLQSKIPKAIVSKKA